MMTLSIGESRLYTCMCLYMCVCMSVFRVMGIQGFTITSEDLFRICASRLRSQDVTKHAYFCIYRVLAQYVKSFKFTYNTLLNHDDRGLVWGKKQLNILKSLENTTPFRERFLL